MNSTTTDLLGPNGQSFADYVGAITQYVESKPWAVGLIVGPIQWGKSTLARGLWPENQLQLFKEPKRVFSNPRSFDAIMHGWLGPLEVRTFDVFADNLRRVFRESNADPLLLDEFTSFMRRREIAKSACLLVREFISSHKRRVVVVSYQDDVIKWLRPDWIVDLAQHPSHPMKETATRPAWRST